MLPRRVTNNYFKKTKNSHILYTSTMNLYVCACACFTISTFDSLQTLDTTYTTKSVYEQLTIIYKVQSSRAIFVEKPSTATRYTCLNEFKDLSPNLTHLHNFFGSNDSSGYGHVLLYWNVSLITIFVIGDIVTDAFWLLAMGTANQWRVMLTRVTSLTQVTHFNFTSHWLRYPLCSILA